MSVYLVTDPAICAARGVEATVAAALAGGATAVQLRDKAASDDALHPLATRLQTLTRQAGALFVVNDRVDLANTVGADALHIGQQDGDPLAVRAALRPEIALGLSIETLAQARAAPAGVVDYIGAGPVFATATKADHATPVGLHGLSAICAASPAPAVAIGGLGVAQTAAAIRAGAAGVAVVSAICAAEDPEAAARRLAAAVRAGRRRRPA